MHKHTVDLEVALPAEEGSCAACIGRLLSSLRAVAGIGKAHVDRSDAARPRLCLHYDANVLQLGKLRSVVERSGADLRSRFEHVSAPVTGIRHQRQARQVEEAMARQPGVLSASTASGMQRVLIEFDPSLTTRAAVLAAIGAVAGAGVRAQPAAKPHVHAEGEAPHAERHGHGGPFGERSELVFSLACGVLAGAGWALAKAGVPPQVPLACFVLAYVLGAWFPLKEVFVALRAKTFEIDFLMLLAAAGAAVLGQWFEGALLLFLFTLGHALEGFAMGRARKAIESLAKLAPATALRLDEAGNAAEIPVESLAIADRVLVKPNTRIPADGFVLSGTSSVDQAPITGESVPVDKRPVPDAAAAGAAPVSIASEHRVFAGTINGPSALTIAVTRAASDSTLARVVQMVADAQTQKSPTQVFTDRFERIFVPAVLVLAIVLLFAWTVVDEPFSDSFYRAMAVLVAASPCALAIATPSAVLSGVARAARGGVLIKGGAHLESLGSVTAMAFDKTGTLTEGKPRLTDVIVAEGTSEADFLRVAVAVEKQSDHPLAIAIVAGAAVRVPGQAPLEASGVEAIIGFGVRASVDGVPVLIGKIGLFTRDAPLPTEVAAAAERLQADGRTIMIVKRGERFLGVLGVMDTPRPSAPDVIARLHALGISQTIMLTGDNQRVADAVAKQVGIRTARGDLLPEQKVSAIAELAGSSSLVAMVGDGVNDAPAMANATVGITMGAGGSDVALETADVALMADDLTALPFAVGLSRAARRIIRQNLWASLGMVAFLVPATIFGFAGIGIAVTLHEGSTLVVVANALRLLAYRDPRQVSRK